MNTYLTEIDIGDKIYTGPDIKSLTFEGAECILSTEYNNNYRLVGKLNKRYDSF